jgi:hypothetical protein
MPIRSPFIRITIVAVAVLAAEGPAVAGDRLEGWARRGAVYQRTPMDGGTAQACAALCARDRQCRSWVWTRPGLDGPDAQCALLSSAPTPYRAPGQTTGLGVELVRSIEEAATRPPTQREIDALRATLTEPHK